MVQRFLHDIRKDTQKRAEKTQQALAATAGKNKKLSQKQADAFFQRLQNDGERRKKARYVSIFPQVAGDDSNQEEFIQRSHTWWICWGT